MNLTVTTFTPHPNPEDKFFRSTLRKLQLLLQLGHSSDLYSQKFQSFSTRWIRDYRVLKLKHLYRTKSDLLALNKQRRAIFLVLIFWCVWDPDNVCIYLWKGFNGRKIEHFQKNGLFKNIHSHIIKELWTFLPIT